MISKINSLKNIYYFFLILKPFLVSKKEWTILIKTGYFKTLFCIAWLAQCILTLCFSAPRLWWKNKPSLFENVSNLIHEILYDNFDKNIYQKFIVKTVIQKLMCEISCIFKEKCFFSVKNKAPRNKILNLV